MFLIQLFDLNIIRKVREVMSHNELDNIVTFKA